MTTGAGLQRRTVTAVRRLERAASAFLAALDGFDDTMTAISDDSMDVDWDLTAFLEKASGMRGHTPCQGEPCWSAWEQGEEFYVVVDKLVDACGALLQTSK